MKPLSLKMRLSLLVSVLALAVILTVSIVAYVELEESLLNNVDEILRAMGAGIVAALDKHETPEKREAEFRLIVSNGVPGTSAWYRVWVDGSEQDLFASDLPPASYKGLFLHPPGNEQPEVGESGFFNLIADDAPDKRNPNRAVWMRHASGQDVLNILVGRSSHYVYHELSEFYRLLLIVGTSVTLLTFMLVPVLISWGLRPIARASAQLRRITHKSLKPAGERSEVADELKPFVAALDDMLARLYQAMRRQEQFIADAAHELRTPVALVKSTLQTARLRPRTGTEYETTIDEVLQDIGRLERLTEQLLSLARLEEADKQHLATGVRLDALLGEMVEIFDAQASQQGGRVILSTPGAMWVRGNATQMRQLFSNLLDNATRHGPPRATVRVTVEDGPDRQVNVSIHDEGGQIPPEAQAHLFDRFYRVDSSRAQASGGSGLGLGIAREIARRHGGDLQITSNPQTGTIASVRLPKR